jgi:clan AA aspartic protease (TIGR02281 family)
MAHDDLGDGNSSGWGTGLLWPVLRYAAIAALLMATAHWLLGTGSSGPSWAQAVGESPGTMGAPAGSGPAPASEEIADVSGERTIRADAYGHFLLDAVVNGETVQFLVDTGASTLVLSRDDAQKLGLDSNALSFDQRYQTANGIALGALVRLREFSVGSFTLHDIPATVMAQPMPVSLLGTSVLSRFAGHDVVGNHMVLKW